MTTTDRGAARAAETGGAGAPSASRPPAGLEAEGLPPTVVVAVTVYGDTSPAGRFGCRTLTIREAIAFHARPDRSVGLMLGRMRPGYLGREVVTLDDLLRWESDPEGLPRYAYDEAVDR